jgi:uracil-DNA glycosylase
MIASLQHWWSMAGVDLDYAHEPRSLSEESGLQTSGKSVSKPAFQDQVHESKTAFVGKQDFPVEVEDFLNWLRNPVNLVESSWAREFVLPLGPTEPEFMIVTAMPERSSQKPVGQFSPKSLELVQNIMKALGAGLDQCFQAPLALGRPIDGRIAEQYMMPLVDRTLHLISLIKPRRIILFGDTVSRGFLKEDLLTARKKKQYINHISSKTEAVVTFHPRILLERPELKTEAWKDLQQLTRIGVQ